jgi:hypothetical protein
MRAVRSDVSAGFGTDTNGLMAQMPPSAPQGHGGPNPQFLACVAQQEKTLDCNRSDLGAVDLKKCKTAAYNACVQVVPPIPQWTWTCVANCGRPLIKYTSAFPACTLGSHTWDYNIEGVAHYGLLWDFLTDVELNVPGGTEVHDNMMNGAEYFFQTWKKAEIESAHVQ